MCYFKVCSLARLIQAQAGTPVQAFTTNQLNANHSGHNKGCTCPETPTRLPLPAMPGASATISTIFRNQAGLRAVTKESGGGHSHCQVKRHPLWERGLAFMLPGRSGLIRSKIEQGLGRESGITPARCVQVDCPVPESTLLLGCPRKRHKRGRIRGGGRQWSRGPTEYRVQAGISRKVLLDSWRK